MKAEQRISLIPEGKLIPMPLKTYIQMSEQHAVDVHLRNLLITYGLVAVAQSITRLNREMDYVDQIKR